jgi:hypothetical protein
MIALIIFAIYIAGIFGMWLWDSFIGLAIDFDGYEGPPLALACVFWPLAFPIALMVGFGEKLNNVKKRRLEREAHQAKVRVAAQKELDIYMQEVEEELRTVVRRTR